MAGLIKNRCYAPASVVEEAESLRAKGAKGCLVIPHNGKNYNLDFTRRKDSSFGGDLIDALFVFTDHTTTVTDVEITRG